MSGERPILQVEQLARSYGGLQAVKRLSFTVEAGEFVGLIGPNGAGKSTAIDCISGQVRPSAGRVLFDGRDITGWPLHRVARLGLVRTFQASRPFGRMSVLSNLMAAPPHQPGDGVARAVAGGWKAAEMRSLALAAGLLARFDLEGVASSYGGEVSGGQRRLTEISRALMAGPRLLLLDEPFAGVSPTNRGYLADHLRRLCEEGLTIVMVEHRLEMVERLCPRILVMAEGTLVAEGSMASLRQSADVAAAYLGGTTP